MTYLIENTFFVLLLCGLIFALTGYFSLKYPPKTINYFYGYRTSSSMKSQERWDFSQKYASTLLLKYGIILMLISVLKSFINFSEGTSVFIEIGIILLGVVLVLVKTESEIKRRFNKKTNR